MSHNSALSVILMLIIFWSILAFIVVVFFPLDDEMKNHDEWLQFISKVGKR
jgi:hypothetical protein